MDFKKKRNVAITAGLTAVLALSPVVVPAATAFANQEGDGAALTQVREGYRVLFTVTDPATGNPTTTNYYDVRDGSSQRVDTSQVPDVPTHEGYEFVGWKCDLDGMVYSADELSSILVYENTRFTTEWKQVETQKPEQSHGTVYFWVDDQCYTITLTNEYGSSFDEYVAQLKKDYPTATVKDGYYFQGWVDESGNAVDDNLVITNSPNSAAPAELTVKATFSQNQATHTVTFFDENGKGICTTAKQGDLPLSEYISMLQESGFDTSREGFGLTWTTKSGDVVLESDIISGDLNLYARWDAIHTVNFFDKDGKGLGTIALAGDQELSAYVERLEQGVDIPFVDGYTFAGWATKSGDAVLSTDTISGDLNLYAQYTKDPATYTVNFFDENGRGLCTVALSGNHTLQEYIDRLYESVDVPFRDGCYIEWTTKSGDVVLSTDTIQGTLNLYLNFRQSPATHTVNFFDADGNGLATIAKSGDLAFSAYTDTLAESGIEAPYKEGYTFIGWTTKSGDAILSGDVISGDINVYATYQKNAAIHTVNFFDEDGNGLCTTTNAGDVAFSEYVAKLLEVTEIPTKDGYVFAGWVTKSGDKILNTDVISGDINVYASYEKVVDPVAETHKVTFDDCLESTENQVVVVEDGQAVAKPADPTCEGYAFVGWFSDTELTQEWDFSTPVTEDMTLWAKWEKNADAVDPGEDVETPSTPSEDDSTDATDETEDVVPNTGDASIAVSGIALVGAALAGAGALLKRRR